MTDETINKNVFLNVQQNQPPVNALNGSKKR